MSVGEDVVKSVVMHSVGRDSFHEREEVEMGTRMMITYTYYATYISDDAHSHRWKR